MPTSLRDRVVEQVLEKVRKRSDQLAGKNMEENPCDTCLRWEECNGVDKKVCPFW